MQFNNCIIRNNIFLPFISRVHMFLRFFYDVHLAQREITTWDWSVIIACQATSTKTKQEIAWGNRTKRLRSRAYIKRLYTPCYTFSRCIMYILELPPSVNWCTSFLRKVSCVNLATVVTYSITDGVRAHSVTSDDVVSTCENVTSICDKVTSTGECATVILLLPNTRRVRITGVLRS